MLRHSLSGSFRAYDTQDAPLISSRFPESEGTGSRVQSSDGHGRFWASVSAAALQEVFGDVSISGCWFHFGQSIVKRVNKIGLKEKYLHDEIVTDVVRCLLGLPLLPAADIVTSDSNNWQWYESFAISADTVIHAFDYIKAYNTVSESNI